MPLHVILLHVSCHTVALFHPAVADITTWLRCAVFLVYLYQRWIYPVDKKRANEFGCAPLCAWPACIASMALGLGNPFCSTVRTVPMWWMLPVCHACDITLRLLHPLCRYTAEAEEAAAEPQQLGTSGDAPVPAAPKSDSSGTVSCTQLLMT